MSDTIKIKKMKEIANPLAPKAEQIEEPFYPVTHEKAVRDDAGNSLGSKLSGIEDTLTSGAVRADIAQNFTQAQKAQALSNIGITGIDTTVTSGSTHLITSGGVDQKFTDLLSGEYSDDVPTLGSNGLVKSGGVYDFVHTYELVSSLTYEQTSRNSGYKELQITEAGNYLITVQISGMSQQTIARLTDISLFARASGSSIVKELLPDINGHGGFVDGVASVQYNAVSPSQYIMIAFDAGWSYEAGNSITIIVEKETEKYALNETVGNLSNLETEDKSSIVNAINSLKDYTDNKVYEYKLFSELYYEQTVPNSGYKAFTMKRGKNYILHVQFSGFSSLSQLSAIEFYGRNAASTIVDSAVLTELGGVTALGGGNVVEIPYTPSDDINYAVIQFFSDTSIPSGNTVSFKAIEKLEKCRKALAGQTVLMLGDSITQLPVTGSLRGKGIVEYFAEMTGANTIRGAFGGSHIRARRILNSVDDIVDLSYALAAFDLVYVVRALCTQDWTLQDAAMTWLQANDPNYDTYWPIELAELKSIDMSTVNIITIFSGTNDYANNVPLAEPDDTYLRYENGAWNDILTNLSTTYKKLSVYVFSPIVRMIYENDTWVWCEEAQNEANLKLSDYVENNINAAKRFQFPACDLFHTMGWNKYNFWEYFNSNDGTHPRKGFQDIGIKIGTFVTSNQNRYF